MCCGRWLSIWFYLQFPTSKYPLEFVTRSIGLIYLCNNTWNRKRNVSVFLYIVCSCGITLTTNKRTFSTRREYNFGVVVLKLLLFSVQRLRCLLLTCNLANYFITLRIRENLIHNTQNAGKLIHAGFIHIFMLNGHRQRYGIHRSIRRARLFRIVLIAISHTNLIAAITICGNVVFFDSSHVVNKCFCIGYLSILCDNFVFNRRLDHRFLTCNKLLECIFWEPCGWIGCMRSIHTAFCGNSFHITLWPVALIANKLIAKPCKYAVFRIGNRFTVLIKLRNISVFLNVENLWTSWAITPHTAGSRLKRYNNRAGRNRTVYRLSYYIRNFLINCLINEVACMLV